MLLAAAGKAPGASRATIATARGIVITPESNEEERKVSDLDVNTSRLCALLSKIIQSGSHGPPKYNSKLYRALVDTINLINNSKLNFEALL